MKSVSTLLWASAVLGAHAALDEAVVYLWPESPQQQSQPQAPSISPNDARLLFAQRLGVSEYHSLGDAGDSTLKLLNEYGGKQRPLFYNEGHDASRRLLLVIEGIECCLEDLVGVEPAFKINHPPSSSANLQLITDLLQQDAHRRASQSSSKGFSACERSFGEKGTVRGGIHGGYTTKNSPSACDQFATTSAHSDKNEAGAPESDASIIQLLESYFSREHGQTGAIQLSTLEEAQGNKAAYDSAIKDLKDTLHQIGQLSAHNNLEVTIVLMPATSKSAKRSPSPYGTYTTPSHITRRAQPQTEEPLSAFNPPHPAAASSSRPETLATSTSAPVKGVLPLCHSTRKTAISSTHNCSAHGVPFLKYQTRSSSDSNIMIDCWACKCGTTVTEDEKGRKKTVYWGGPACQKKDVSVAFWLLAALGIGLASTISWGVGLMYSIGDEELPSVIGAGVAGPRAQK